MDKAKENALIKARSLRKNMTPQERKFWYCYAKKSRFHWYRQRNIDCYIIDFYCPKAKLAVEIDGS
jgi:very-short-patch-repair endonuclease